MGGHKNTTERMGGEQVNFLAQKKILKPLSHSLTQLIMLGPSKL